MKVNLNILEHLVIITIVFAIYYPENMRIWFSAVIQYILIKKHKHTHPVQCALNAQTFL